MQNFALLPDDSMYIFPPQKPVIEGPELSDIEKLFFIIIVAVLTIAAVAVTVYFVRLLKMQALKDKTRLIENQRKETIIHANGKDNICS